MSSSSNSIYTALLEVYKAVGYVQKKGKVSAGKINYRYAGEADLISALRPAMIEAGIVVYPHKIKHLELQDYLVKDNYGEKRHNRTICHIVFRFTHAASETHVDVPAVGAGIDRGDKDVYKAMTGAFKYALRQAFMIETGDDPDKDASQDHAPVAKVEKPKKKDPNEYTKEEWANKTEQIMQAFRGAKDKKELDKRESAFIETYCGALEIYNPALADEVTQVGRDKYASLHEPEEEKEEEGNE